MMKNFIIILLIVSITSCSEKQENNTLLIGNWKLEEVIDSFGQLKNYYNVKPGIEFTSTSRFRYIPGLLNFTRENFQNILEINDSFICYKLKNNKITYKSLTNNAIIEEKIIQLTSDSLYLLDDNKNVHKYVRIHPNSINNNNIDNIVLSSLGCFGKCTRMDISINNEQSASYYCSAYCGINGLHKGTISKLKVDRLFQLLNFLNIDTLDNLYSAMHTDDETIVVSFYNDNKLVKTISDYGRMAPTELIWLYTYLRYIPELKNLTLHTETDKVLIKPKCYLFIDGEKGFSFERSESYHIYLNLLESKEVNKEVVLPYEIYNYFSIDKLSNFYKYNKTPEIIGYSNGRYFKFKNLENKIFDLGYNCLEKKKPI